MFDLYRRPPNKPAKIQIETPVFYSSEPKNEVLDVPLVDKSTECHVTPSDIATRMVDYLSEIVDHDDGKTAELHAGTGQLVSALLESNCAIDNIIAVEKNAQLCDFLNKRFPALIVNNECAFDFAGYCRDDVSRIIVNPPFKNISTHIDNCLSLLRSDDAVMVVLVPSSYEHDRAEVLENLEAGVFGTTNVKTKIIRFVR